MASSAYEEVATLIKAAFDAEFAAEGYTMEYDHLHEALGSEAIHVGISPASDTPRQNARLVQETMVEVRFYDLWDREIDPLTAIDPRRITGYAQRFRDAVRRANDATIGTANAWFFDVDSITYPNDPTGNKSRFHAMIRCQGNNNNLIETA